MKKEEINGVKNELLKIRSHSLIELFILSFLLIVHDSFFNMFIF